MNTLIKSIKDDIPNISGYLINTNEWMPHRSSKYTYSTEMPNALHMIADSIRRADSPRLFYVVSNFAEKHACLYRGSEIIKELRDKDYLFDLHGFKATKQRILYDAKVANSVKDGQQLYYWNNTDVHKYSAQDAIQLINLLVSWLDRGYEGKPHGINIKGVTHISKSLLDPDYKMKSLFTKHIKGPVLMRLKEYKSALKEIIKNVNMSKAKKRDHLAQRALREAISAYRKYYYDYVSYPLAITRPHSDIYAICNRNRAIKQIENFIYSQNTKKYRQFGNNILHYLKHHPSVMFIRDGGCFSNNSSAFNYYDLHKKVRLVDVNTAKHIINQMSKDAVLDIYR